MGNIIGKCKGRPRSSGPSHVVGEKDIVDDEVLAERFPRRSFVTHEHAPEHFEDLIQDVSSHSRWEFFEVRHLLSQFRELSDTAQNYSVSFEELEAFLPRVMTSVFLDFPAFAKSKHYQKWMRRVLQVILIAPNEKKAVSFPLFAKFLEIACRGSAREKSRLLFRLFDIDSDEAWNQAELALFMDCAVMGGGSSSLSDADDETRPLNSISAGSEMKESASTRRILDREGVFRFVEYLLNPEAEPDAKETEAEEQDDAGPETKDGEADGADGTDGANRPEETKSADQSAVSEKERLKPQKIEDEFLESMTSESLEKMTEEELWDVVLKIMNEHLMKKGRIKMKRFIAFGERCLKFDVLFKNFNIIPTRHDEKMKIKEMMLLTQTEMGQSWCVISQNWWDAWCTYADFHEDTEETQTSGGIGVTHQKLRPLKINNDDLLDPGSHFRILKQKVGEGKDFQIIPQRVWNQLVAWYGGGPEISREVVCTDPKIRLQVLEAQAKVLVAAYMEKERERAEASKKSKKKDKKEKNKEKEKDKSPKDAEEEEESMTSAETKGAELSVEEATASYERLLQELAPQVQTATLVIDLRPVYLQACRMNKKGKVDAHDLHDDPVKVSRYITLPELYITVAASLGEDVFDIKRVKAGYEQYFEEKAAAQAEKKKSKKEKKKDKEKAKEREAEKVDKAELPLPPRLWEVSERTHKETNCIYPLLPKAKLAAAAKTKPVTEKPKAGARSAAAKTQNGRQAKAPAQPSEPQANGVTTAAAAAGADATVDDIPAPDGDADAQAASSDAGPVSEQPDPVPEPADDAPLLDKAPEEEEEEEAPKADEEVANKPAIEPLELETRVESESRSGTPAGNGVPATPNGTQGLDSQDDLIDDIIDRVDHSEAEKSHTHHSGDGGEMPPPYDSAEPPAYSDDAVQLATVGNDGAPIVGGATAAPMDEEPDPEQTEEESIHHLGIATGMIFALEFADQKKRKYPLRSKQEEKALEEPIDDSWKEWEVGHTIDGRDRPGKWYEATIRDIKPAGEAITKDAKLKKHEDPDHLKKFVGLFLKYKEWEEKWNEWIYVEPEVICTCRQVCIYRRHRLAPFQTQSKWKQSAMRSELSDRGWGGSSYGRGGRRGTITGAPATEGVVGLANLGNTCFMNSILQCISNTPHFRTFFTSGRFKADVNRDNPLGQQGALASEFANLLSDIWSGKYRVVAPRAFKKAIAKFAPMFSGWQQHDSQEFLGYLLDGLHEDLNLVKRKPYTEKIEADGRPDEVVAKLSWKIHLMRNESKVVDLFQAQLKSRVVCPDCARISITFDTYMYLSVPIAGSTTKRLLVDVYHLGHCAEPKPYRRVFEMRKFDKIRDLCAEVAGIYGCNPQFVICYDTFNQKIGRELDNNMNLGMCHDNTAISCFILRDWNKEVTAEDMKKHKLDLFICKVSHVKPLDAYLANASGKNSASKVSQRTGGGYRGYRSTYESPNFGLPFVFAFLNIHTNREMLKVVWQRLYKWVPQILEKCLKDKNIEVTPTHGQWFVATPAPAAKPQADAPDSGDAANGAPNGVHAAEAAAEKKSDDEEKKADEGNPNLGFIDFSEEDWDKIIANLPFTVRRLPYAHYHFNPSKKLPEPLEANDGIFAKSSSKSSKQGFELVVEWHADYFEGDKMAKDSLVKVIVHESYREYKKQREAMGSRTTQGLSLYECLDAYMSEEILTKDDVWYCSVCKKHQEATKKLDLWSFPEILVVHLKRFQVLSRSGRGEKINTFVEYPIRGLDLSKYVINRDLQAKPIYDLFAVSCHSGSCGGGHYTAYGLNAKSDRWYYFNDSHVSAARPSDIVTGAAYVLFYKRNH